jgi:hypothetical protein
MKGVEYVQMLIEQFAEGSPRDGGAARAAFISAALAIAEVVESPAKEEALARLAVMSLNGFESPKRKAA